MRFDFSKWDWYSEFAVFVTRRWNKVILRRTTELLTLENIYSFLNSVCNREKKKNEHFNRHYSQIKYFKGIFDFSFFCFVLFEVQQVHTICTRFFFSVSLFRLLNNDNNNMLFFSFFFLLFNAINNSLYWNIIDFFVYFLSIFLWL